MTSQSTYFGGDVTVPGPGRVATVPQLKAHLGGWGWGFMWLLGEHGHAGD
jgi:hypothetical protein